MNIYIIMHTTRNNIYTVIERLFTIVAGGPDNTMTSTQNFQASKSKYEHILNQIENIYGVKIPNDIVLDCEQITDICYNECRKKALQKVKQLIGEYDITAHEVFEKEFVSIH